MSIHSVPSINLLRCVKKVLIFFCVCSALVMGVFFMTSVYGQLPPTVYRVSERDSAVDIQVLGQSIVASVNKSFGTAIRLRQSLILSGDPLLSTRPLTVTPWVKLSQRKQFNIFLANEEKSSPRHWELYTFAGTGQLSLYIPGNPSGDTLSGGPNLVDGQWHYVGLVLGPEETELFVDGKSVARGKYDRPETPVPAETLFSIGSLVNGQMLYDGFLDELCISRGSMIELSVSNMNLPQTVKNSTLLLCHFNSLSEPTAEPSQFPIGKSGRGNAATVDRFAQIPKYLRASELATALPDDVLSLEEVVRGNDQKFFFKVEGQLAAKYNGKIQSTALGNTEKLFPTEGLEIVVPPGYKPKRNIPIKTIEKNVFNTRVGELGLTSITYDDFRPGVREHWGEHFMYWSDRLSGKVQLPRGAAEQVYDKNTLIFPERERYPVQVILRQTAVLLNWLEWDVSTSSRSDSADIPNSLKTTLADWRFAPNVVVVLFAASRKMHDFR